MIDCGRWSSGREIGLDIFGATHVGGPTRMNRMTPTAPPQCPARLASDAEDVLRAGFDGCAQDGSEWPCVGIPIERPEVRIRPYMC